MRGAHEVVEPVTHQRALDLEQPRGDAQPRHATPTSRGLEPPLEAGEARLDAIGGLAQLVDAAQELLDLGLAHEIAALLVQILGDVLAGRAPPRAQRARRSRRARARRAGRSPMQPDSSSSQSGRASRGARGSARDLRIAAISATGAARNRRCRRVARTARAARAGAPAMTASAGRQPRRRRERERRPQQRRAMRASPSMRDPGRAVQPPRRGRVPARPSMPRLSRGFDRRQPNGGCRHVRSCSRGGRRRCRR